jgi:hypothetical protein
MQDSAFRQALEAHSSLFYAADRETGGSGGGTERLANAQRVMDLLQHRFASLSVDQRQNATQIQAERDLATVANLSQLLMPDVNAFAAIDALSSLDSDEPSSDSDAELQVRLKADLIFSSLAELLAADVQRIYQAMRTADPSTQATDSHRGPFPGGPIVAGNVEAILRPPLNADQQRIYDAIMSDITGGKQVLAIVHGMPGTGKTELALRLREALRPNGVLVCAPTGKAAAHHANGQTIQGAFRLGILTNKLQPIARLDDRVDARRVLESCQVLFIDEYSMCDARVFALVDERYKDLQIAVEHETKPFRGRSVVLFGDPFQLPAVGVSLYDIACDDSKPASSLLGKARERIRSFSQYMLTEIMRTRDPFWAAFLKRLCNPEFLANPITPDILRTTCSHCQGADGKRVADPIDHEPSLTGCPRKCPHRCQHFKELTSADIAVQPSWLEAKLVAPYNSTVDAFTLVKLRAFAIKHQQVVIRWRLILASPDVVSEYLADADEAERFPQLFGYFVLGAPVRLTQNTNTRVQLAHGVAGNLHSIVVADPAALRASIADGQYAAGDVLTLSEAPEAVNVTIKSLRQVDSFSVLQS